MSSLSVEITPRFDCGEDDDEKELDACDEGEHTSDDESNYREDERIPSSYSPGEDRKMDQIISRDIYLLPVRYWNIRHGAKGLLLQPTGTQNGQYRRLGTYYSSSDKFDELRRFAESQAVPDDFTGECSSKNGKMQHIVDLV
jgi:hypothetical protein